MHIDGFEVDLPPSHFIEGYCIVASASRREFPEGPFLKLIDVTGSHDKVILYWIPVILEETAVVLGGTVKTIQKKKNKVIL